eukprot:m.125294 g.125294  ORF g.125294 m.125294 type:complete len:206 (-) comp15614_c1_seq3:99-716(-)
MSLFIRRKVQADITTANAIPMENLDDHRQSIVSAKDINLNLNRKNGIPLETTPAFMRRFHMHDTTDRSQKAPTNAYGTLRFMTNEKEAPYLVLSHEDDPGHALEFVQSMLWQRYGRRYQKPSLLLSVTGGALNFTLPQHLETAVTKGLSLAARRTNAWVVTGGTHTGPFCPTLVVSSSAPNQQKLTLELLEININKNKTCHSRGL